MKEKNARFTRWSLSLQPFDLTVVHHRGVDNCNVDVLSCYYGSDKGTESSQENPVVPE